jgi:hypothetical protein
LLLILAPSLLSLFPRILLLQEERLFLLGFAWENHLMIGSKLRQGMKRAVFLGVCGMFGEGEYSLFHMNEILPSMIEWRLENQSLVKE